MQCHTLVVPHDRVFHVARSLGIPSKVALLYLEFVGSPHSAATSKLTADGRRQLLEVRVVDIKRDARAQASTNRRMPRRAERFWEEDEWGYASPIWVGPDTLTTRQAAEAVRVTPDTIRKWVARGHLSPVGRRGKTNLFDARDVMAADRATDQRNRQPRVNGTRNPTAWRPGVDARRGVTAASLADLVDATEAARSAGVSTSTVRSWVSRGHLRVASNRGRTRLFIRQDVLRAARRNPHKTPRKLPVF